MHACAWAYVNEKTSREADDYTEHHRPDLTGIAWLVRHSCTTLTPLLSVLRPLLPISKHVV